MNNAALLWAPSARILVFVVGGILMGRGWATQEQVTAAASNADLLAIVASALAIIGSAFYALKSRTTKGLIAATANLPQVTEIQTISPRLADAIPSDKVVPADTAARPAL